MPSQAVLDRDLTGRLIIEAARTHARQVAEALALALSEVVEEGETLPDFELFQLQLARLLERRLNVLIAADEAHVQELDDDLDPRLRRDAATQALYDKMIQIRGTLNGAFGQNRVDALLGISGKTPRESRRLYRHVTRAIERLREPAPELPEFRLNGLQLDRSALAEELQPAADDLALAMADVTRELKETETSLQFKNEAIEEYDSIVGGIARALIGLDELAGFPEYARKVRLGVPNRGGSSAPEETPPTEEEPAEEEPVGTTPPETPPGQGGGNSN